MATETNIEKMDSDVTQVERTRSGPAFVPNCDIVEKPDELLLVADIPGARAEDIDIDYENGQLSIHAKIEPRQEAERTEYLLNEYSIGDFYRTFQIGEGVDATGIAAEVKDGVLTLHLPKSEALKPKKIAVSATS